MFISADSLRKCSSILKQSLALLSLNSECRGYGELLQSHGNRIVLISQESWLLWTDIGSLNMKLKWLLISSGPSGHPFTPSLSSLFWSLNSSHYVSLNSGNLQGEAPQSDFQRNVWVMSRPTQKKGQWGDTEYKCLHLPEHTKLRFCNSDPRWGWQPHFNLLSASRWEGWDLVPYGLPRWSWW